jgi:amicyanin
MRLIRLLIATGLLAGCVLLRLAAPAVAAGHSVTISGYAFQPAMLTIRAGDTVTWTNRDTAPHDVTTTSAPVAIHGAQMTKGQSWSYTFTTPGTYSYICSIHPDMRAMLVVQPAPTRAATATHARVPAPAATTHYLTPHASPVKRHSRRHRRAAPSHPAPPAPTSPSATVAAAPTAASSTPERPLRPLLVVAGVIAAVATLSLLLLAGRPEGGDPASG